MDGRDLIMAKVYSIEPVSFGFRPTIELMGQNGKEGAYLRFRYGVIEKLSVARACTDFPLVTKRIAVLVAAITALTLR